MAFDKSVMAAVIRSRRAALDITQGELARRVGVNVTTVCAWEDPEGGYIPGADKVWALSGALVCQPNELLGWQTK